jgi:hypothetical protein
LRGRRSHERRATRGCATRCVAFVLGGGGLLMSLLISVLITFLVVILVLYLVNMLPIDGRVKRIIHVVVIIVGVLSLLRHLGVWI